MQPNQPPTTPAHGNRGDEHADNHARDGALPRPAGYPHTGTTTSSNTTAIVTHDNPDTGTRAKDEKYCHGIVVAPAPVARVPPKYGEEPKHLDAEEREAEDLARGRQPRSEYRRGHECGVGGQRGGDVDADAARVVKEEDVDGQEPEGHGPDTVARGRLCEGFEDWREPEKGRVDENSALDGAEALVETAVVVAG